MKKIDSRPRKIFKNESISSYENESIIENSGLQMRQTPNQISQTEEEISYVEYKESPPSPPDGGYGWIIVFASFMCNMIVDGIAYTFGVFLKEFVQYYGQGKGKVAWVGSLLSGTYLIVGPLVSALMNRFGCRVVCIAGGVISSVAFILSAFCSDSLSNLMLTYGIMGGIGFGLIYLPAVVSVGYYFEKRRSLATGIAVCGSGFGTFTFAPFASTLIETFGWKGALLILAGLILNCTIFGALMRPLTYTREDEDENGSKPLLQRMAEEKRIQMERGSIGGSYFMVQLPDGTKERRMKMPINIDPGVHSSFNLNEVGGGGGGGLTPVPTLPTIIETSGSGTATTSDSVNSNSTNPIQKISFIPPISHISKIDLNNKDINQTNLNDIMNSELDSNNIRKESNFPRNASQPAMSLHSQNLPKNGSVPFFDRSRKTSINEKYRPTLTKITSTSGDVTRVPSRISNIISSDVESMASINKDRSLIVRPLSRKDIFYSGSITNLQEYQSQKSLNNYRQSVLSLSRQTFYDKVEPEQPDLCPCLKLPESFKATLLQMLDLSLLSNPVFLLISISNIFGMAGLYVPFVYLVDAAILNGIDANSASFLISVIGITNTIGRVVCGFVADFPSVNSLFLNNVCLLISTVSVLSIPFCNSYAAYIFMSIGFGFAVSGYISLTSIILVDLLGLDRLTNAFGLVILFRGAATIIGSPLAGFVYDKTGTYNIPFLMAGAFFAIATVTSFLAPALKRFAPNQTDMCAMDVLEPINEVDNENEIDDDGPIIIANKCSNIHIDIDPKPEVIRFSNTSETIAKVKTAVNCNKNNCNIDEPEFKQIESSL